MSNYGRGGRPPAVREIEQGKYAVTVKGIEYKFGVGLDGRLRPLTVRVGNDLDRGYARGIVLKYMAKQEVE